MPASPESSQLLFAPVTWKEIATQDCDAQGLVFFDMETGKLLKPSFALKLTNRSPDIVELTPELKQWINTNDMDILFHFGSKSWEKMRLEMQEDFLGQQNEWETIKPEKVWDHFAEKDAAGFVRNYLPGTSSSMDYHGDWSSCQAFRTRTNTMGVLQDEGFENTSVRGVRIRYKLVQSRTKQPPHETHSPAGENESVGGPDSSSIGAAQPQEVEENEVEEKPAPRPPVGSESDR